MNPKKLIKSIKALSGWRESAFLLALAERALPNAILFLESTDQLDLDEESFPNGLYSLMDASWQHAILNQDETKIIEALDQVVANMVEGGDDSFGVLPCNHCLEIWELALVSVFNRDKKRAEDGSQVSISTVSEFIEFTEGEGLDENALIRLFEKHDLMAREFSFQQELCDVLRAADKLSKDLVVEVRDLASDEGVSNLGISLDEL